MMKLEGKVAIVTGGARGNGLAAARFLAQEGADIAIADICEDMPTVPYALSSDATMEGAVKEIKGMGRKAVGIKCDIRKSSDVEAMVKQVLDALGKVDILVNNAGITKDGLIMRMSEADWDAVLDVNLKGTFLFTKAFSRSFLKQRSGRIVNIASVIGLIGNAGQCNYGASKAGVIGLTKSAARELASRGVTVNAIAPGFIETAMTAKISPEAREALMKQIPLGVLGQAEDVADAVLFLAGPGARYITGQVLPVDGGMAM
jgi:3-oxoacyl-[acyl-carrier protein] reductase